MSQKIISTYRSAGSATAPKHRRSTGNWYEQLAAEHLEKQGLQLIRSNYHCRLGEIDLIMQDQNTLVFVEVRYRLRNDFVSAVVSINPTKQQKILRTAMVYLKQRQGTLSDRPDRPHSLQIDRRTDSRVDKKCHYVKRINVSL